MNTDLSKHVLFLDAYYEPEQTAFTHLENDIIDGLINQGFRVSIICPQPSRGVSKCVHREYKNKKIESYHNGSLIIKRFNCWRERSNPLSRFLRYLYIGFASFSLAKKEKDVDIVFCNSTPPTQGLTAGKVKKYYEKKHKRKIAFIYNLQDLFPDSLSAAHLARENGVAWKIGLKISRDIFSMADKIIAISFSFKDKLINRGVTPNKIKVIYNWVDLTKILPINRKNNVLFDELGIDRSKKIAVYAGNFGAAQDIDSIIEAAHLLEEENIFFVLFGRGSCFETIKAKANNFSNIMINDLQPANRISEVYSLGDVGLVSCKKGFGVSSFPSKTWSILACDTYIIASFDKPSELSTFLEKERCGIVVEPGRPDLLANAILDFFKYTKKDYNARQVVSKVACKQSCVNEFIEVFNCE